jgi:hypothetical protein
MVGMCDGSRRDLVVTGMLVDRPLGRYMNSRSATAAATVSSSISKVKGWRALFVIIMIVILSAASGSFWAYMCRHSTFDYRLSSVSLPVSALSVDLNRLHKLVAERKLYQQRVLVQHAHEHRIDRNALKHGQRLLITVQSATQPRNRDLQANQTARSHIHSMKTQQYSFLTKSW